MSSFKDKLAKARAASPRTADAQIALDTAAVDMIGRIEQEMRAADTRFDEQARSVRDEIKSAESENRMVNPRIAALEADLEKIEEQRKERLDTLQAELDTAADAASESLVTLRFTRMPGQEWAELCAVNPPRAGVLLDSQYGYDYQAVGAEAAKSSGVTVDGDDTVELEPAEWVELFKVMSGHEFEKVCSVLFSLNEWGPEQAVRILGKASRDAANRKSPSPTPSE